jgi:hypothetical protein
MPVTIYVPNLLYKVHENVVCRGMEISIVPYEAALPHFYSLPVADTTLINYCLSYGHLLVTAPNVRSGIFSFIRLNESFTFSFKINSDMNAMVKSVLKYTEFPHTFSANF